MARLSNFYRGPIWQNLVPKNPQFCAASSEDTIFLQQAMGDNGRAYRLESQNGGEGFFRFDQENGTQKFVKVIPESELIWRRQAESIARDVFDAGVQSVFAEDRVASLNDGGALLIYPFVDITYVQPSGPDIMLLGAAIARLHGVLASHQSRGMWRSATVLRLALLDDVRQQIKAGKRRFSPEPEKLQKIAELEIFDVMAETSEATPLHGDLNPYNVIKRDGQIAFIDFEDTAHSVLPVIYELGYVIERFILVRVEDNIQAQKLIGCLIRGYTEAGGNVGGQSISTLWQVLKTLAFKAMCILAAAELQNDHVPTEEWEKFLRLYDRAFVREMTWTSFNELSWDGILSDKPTI